MFQTKKMKVIKYNYALDEIVQKCQMFNSFIQLSDDGEELIITKKVKYVFKIFEIINLFNMYFGTLFLLR